MKAIIDRFEGNYAVLLCGDNEVQLEVPKELLPEDAKEGVWLDIIIKVDQGIEDLF